MPSVEMPALEAKNEIVADNNPRIEAGDLDPRLQFQVRSFRHQLEEAFSDKKISQKEYDGWMQQGLAATLRDLTITPEEKTKRVHELVTFFHNNVVMNEKKKEMTEYIQREISRSGLFTEEEKQAWLSGMHYIQQQYDEGKIFLQESFNQLKGLHEALPAFLRSGIQQLARFQHIEQFRTQHDLALFTILKKEDICNTASFLSQPYRLREKYIEDLHEKLQQEFDALSAGHPDFCKQEDASRLWKDGPELHEKLPLLHKWHNAIHANRLEQEGREQYLQGQKKYLEDLMNKKQITQAQTLLAKIEQDFGAELFRSHGFHHMVEETDKTLLFRTKLIQKAEVFEKEENLSQALDWYQKAQFVEDDLVLQTRIRNIEAKQSALSHFEQSLDFYSKGQNEVALFHERQAYFEHDSLVHDLVLQKRKEEALQVYRRQQAEQELTEWQQKNSVIQSIRAEQDLVQLVQKKQVETKKIDIYDETSGSVEARKDQQDLAQDLDASSKIVRSEELKKQTQNLKNSESDVTQSKVLKLVVEEQNDANNIHRVIEQIQTEERNVTSLTFSQNEKSTEQMSTVEVADRFREKEKKAVKKKVEELERKNKVTLDAAPFMEKKAA